jgi:hypothetical protein
VPRDHRGEYALLQRRFWEHTIRDDRDFERCADYIHFNPVKHRLATSPVAWPFSSLHRYVRAGVLARDWGGSGVADNVNFGERALDPGLRHRTALRACRWLHPGYKLPARSDVPIPTLKLWIQDIETLESGH